MAQHQVPVRQPPFPNAGARHTRPADGAASSSLLLTLQRHVGNEAVVRMLRSQADVAGDVAAVDGPVPATTGRPESRPPFEAPPNILRLRRPVAGPAAAAPVVRRVILINKVKAPGTRRLLTQKYGKDKETLAKVQDVLDEAKKEIDGEIDIGKLDDAWGRIAKNKNNTYKLDDEDLPVAIAKSYKKSANSSDSYGKRKKDYQKVAAGLKTRGFEVKDSARNPTAQKRKLETFDFDTTMDPAKKEQRHIATVLLKNFGGVESQASFKKDRSGLHISTNRNDVNQRMRNQIKGRKGIKREARVMLTGKSVSTMSRVDAMKDREVRHPLKLLLRLNKFLSASGVVEVPPEVTPFLDGRHAEIRIKQGGGWSQEYYHPPAGTRYPCMGCALHFWSDGVKIGTEMGPMWLTDASLSTQLEDELMHGKKIGALDDPEAISTAILAQFKKIEGKVKQGVGKPRTGKPSDDHDADSESDLDDDDFKRALELVDGSDSESETVEQPRKKARYSEPEKPVDSLSEEEEDVGHEQNDDVDDELDEYLDF